VDKKALFNKLMPTTDVHSSSRKHTLLARSMDDAI